MNWLLIVAIIFLILNIAWGYSRGFLRVVYSIGKWILILAIVIVLTPMFEKVLTEHTSLHTKIEEKIEHQIERKANEKIEEEVDEEAIRQREELEQLGMKLPDSVLQFLPGLVNEAEEKAEEAGIYQAVAKDLATLAVRGIAGLIILIVAIIVCIIISKIFHVIEKLPGIRTINHGLGLFAGFAKGMLLIWCLLALLATQVGTPTGQFFAVYVYDAPILEWLYENNLILALLLAF